MEGLSLERGKNNHRLNCEHLDLHIHTHTHRCTYGNFNTYLGTSSYDVVHWGTHHHDPPDDADYCISLLIILLCYLA